MKRGLLIAGVVAAAVLVGGAAAYQRYPLADIAAVFTGGSAKMLCSDVFVAGRDPDLAYEQDFLARRSSPGKYLGIVHPVVDKQAKTVTADLWGLQRRVALYRPGIGCTAAEGAAVEALKAQGAGVASALPPPDPSLPWPEGGAPSPVPAEVDAARLDGAVEAAFAEPDPEQPKGTRGVVVIYKGRLIAERYAPGFTRDTAHLSNSVAKSVTATLVGILVNEGRLDVNDPAPIAEWRGRDDPRRAITLDNLLRMSSGLRYEESYSKIKSDITMQYVGGDLAGYAAAKPLEAEPGAKWHYSTGTSNILGRIVRETAGPDFPTAFAFPRRALFDPLGMRTAVLEPDAAGNFIGGSSFYASPRDYARLGLLYMNDGVWNGERILPEGWVGYVRKPTPGSPAEYPYGAQFWVNWDGKSDVVRFDRMPRDAFLMNGHQGQHVVMIPSRDLVVVRVGLSEFDTWSINDLVGDILAALPEKAA